MERPKGYRREFHHARLERSLVPVQRIGKSSFNYLHSKPRKMQKNNPLYLRFFKTTMHGINIPVTLGRKD